MDAMFTAVNDQLASLTTNIGTTGVVILGVTLLIVAIVIVKGLSKKAA